MVVTSWNLRRDFVEQITALVDAVENRLLPTFNSIDEDANEVAESRWQEFMASSGTPADDPAAFADAAYDAGISHYILLSSIRQGVLNLAAAGLHHLFEQQMLMLLRRQILKPSEEHDPKLMKLDVLEDRLRAQGIRINHFNSWSKVVELRVLANTIKHAEGGSARRLRRMRPDLFAMPDSASGKRPPLPVSLHLYSPLAGEDLYIQVQDLRAYSEALVGFLNELADAIDEA